MSLSTEFSASSELPTTLPASKQTIVTVSKIGGFHYTGPLSKTKLVSSVLLLLLFILLPSLAVTSFSSQQMRASAITGQSPAACVEASAVEWTFSSMNLEPSTGNGVLTVGPGLGETSFTIGAPQSLGGSSNYALRAREWTSGTLKIESNDVIQFAVNTSGYEALKFSFLEQRPGNNGPREFVLYYSNNGETFSALPAETLPDNPIWRKHEIDLSAQGSLNNNPKATFRLYAYRVENSMGRWSIDDIKIRGTTCIELTPTSPPTPTGQVTNTPAGPTFTPTPFGTPPPNYKNKSFLPYTRRR